MGVKIKHLLEATDENDVVAQLKERHVSALESLNAQLELTKNKRQQAELEAQIRVHTAEADFLDSLTIEIGG